MATTYETLRADIIVSMKARDSVTTTALRTADAGIKRAAMDANKEIDEALTIATMRKAVKNLTDANVEFAKGGRADLVAANESEEVCMYVCVFLCMYCIVYVYVCVWKQFWIKWWLQMRARRCVCVLSFCDTHTYMHIDTYVAYARTNLLFYKMHKL